MNDEEILFYSVGSLQMVSHMEWTSTFGEVIKDSYMPLLPDQVLRGLIDNHLSGRYDVVVDSYVMETRMHGDLASSR